MENADALVALNTAALVRLIENSCRIKAGIVSQDEKETGARAILNFGHTFGHAVESLFNFTQPHGLCVAFGCVAALYLSHKMEKINKQELERAKLLFARFALTGWAVPFSDEQICAQMRLDKKSKDGQINLILLKKIGSAFIDEGASANEIMWAISQAKLW
jgi:3-dehydroquinate synthase